MFVLRTLADFSKTLVAGNRDAPRPTACPAQPGLVGQVSPQTSVLCLTRWIIADKVS